MRYFIAVDERRMSKTVTLRDANQNFAKYVREVQAGEEIVITRRGEPVAKLLPVSRKRVLTPEQQAARRRALARMKKGWDLGDWKIPREEIYDR
jgi:prevent-host-death family protein